MKTPLDEPLETGESIAALVSQLMSLARELLQQLEQLPPSYGEILAPRVLLMVNCLQQAQYEAQQVNGALEQAKKLTIQQKQVAKVKMAV